MPAQEQAQDVALPAGERAEAGRSALYPLPVIGGQVALAIPVMPGDRIAAPGARRRLVQGGGGGTHFREPFTHLFKVPAD